MNAIRSPVSSVMGSGFPSVPGAGRRSYPATARANIGRPSERPAATGHDSTARRSERQVFTADAIAAGVG